MPHVDRTPLGAATTAGKWYLDINTGTYAAPTWTAVNGISNFVPKQDPTLQDDSDYDSHGYGSQAKTGLTWSADITVQRKVTAADPTIYDPGQEALRAAAATLGTGGTVDVRFYEVIEGGPAVEAYRGYAEVSWTPGGGAHNALDAVGITLTGRGVREAITHPDAAAVAPTVYSITPATGDAAGGELVTIAGRDFTDATACSICTDFTVVDDHTIVGITDAHAAGVVNTTVTNATGTSDETVSFTYA